MANLFQKLKNLFSGGEPEPALSMEELRAVFKARYHAFKLLLAANNTALQLMTDMEAALRSRHSFGMTFIRSHATATCVNVFNIIKYLNELTGDRYRMLETVFTTIERKIDATLKQRQAPTITELVLPLTAVRQEMADGVGGKMANLGEITGELPGIAVPPGFAMHHGATYERFLSHSGLTDEINRRLQSMEEEEISDLYRKSSEIQKLIVGADLPPELATAISQAYTELAEAAGGAVKVALAAPAPSARTRRTPRLPGSTIRNSTSARTTSTRYQRGVGQQICPDSGELPPAQGARETKTVAMCVGCMVMVDSACGGVMYSRDPTDNRSDADLSQRGPRAGQICGGRHGYPGFVCHLPGRAPDDPQAGDPRQGTEGRVPPGGRGAHASRRPGDGGRPHG